MDYISIAQSTIAERYPLIVDGIPEISQLPAGAILGSWAYSIPGKVRYILAPELTLAVGTLPGDVTRAWLADEYNLPLRRRKAQIEEKCYSAPLLARKGKWGNCAYVDIAGAYAHILQLGFDLEYRRNRYVSGTPRPLPDQIRANKFCYSIAVSMSHSALSNIAIKGHEGVFETHPFNNYSNPCLYNLALDTLNAIGAEMISVLGNKLFYYNTDGGIVDEDYVDLALDIVHSWGFSARIKHSGWTEIYGVGSYVCGKKKTDQIRVQPMDVYQSTLMPKDERLMLKRQWQRVLHYFLGHDGYSTPASNPVSFKPSHERITFPNAY